MRLITIEMWMKCLNLHTGLQVEIPANILNEGLPTIVDGKDLHLRCLQRSWLCLLSLSSQWRCIKSQFIRELVKQKRCDE